MKKQEEGPMRRMVYLGIVAILVLSFSGCGGGDDRSFRVARIFSDQQADGDIAFFPVSSIFQVTNGPATIFFGIDASDPGVPEYRAFLDFPLDGATGGDVVPAGARIRSATIEVFVNEVSFALTVPTLIDLVSYPISGLREVDFDSLPLTYPDGSFASRTLDFISSDQGNYVLIDVTPLLAEAQRRGLPDFQLRFLLDFVPRAEGLVGIEDLPSATITAPLLTVEYD
jgi:hypothetical protein